MSQGRRNRQLPAGRHDAARRDVAPGQGRARPRPRPRGVRRRDAVATGVRRVRVCVVAAARRAEVLGWLRDPEFLARVGEGVVSAEEQRLLTKSWAATARCRSRTCRCSTSCATPSATCRARDDERRPRRDSPARRRRRPAGADHRAEREYAPTGRAWTPPTHRIEDDGYAHVLIDEAQDLTPMQWRMVGRRGRTATWTIVGDPAQSSWPVPAESAAARAEALEGKTLHEFHLSTNYRNSAEIYDFAAAYAERVGLDADLPDAVRRPGWSRGRRPRRRPRGRCPRRGRESPGGSRARSASWCRSRAAPRSTPGWRPGRSSPTTPRRAAAVDSRSPPRGEDRIVVLTGLDTKGLEFDGIVVVSPRRSRTSRPPAGPRCTSSSPAPRSCSPPSADPPEVGETTLSGQKFGGSARSGREPGRSAGQ